MPEDTQLQTFVLTEEEQIKDIEAALDQVSSKFTVFDISLIKDHSAVKPNGKVQVSIPVPAGYDTTKLALYHFGSGEGIHFEIIDGYLVFETDSFSRYVVAEKNKTPQPSTDDQSSGQSHSQDSQTTAAQTSDEAPVGFLIMLTAAAGIAILVIWKKRRSLTQE